VQHAGASKLQVSAPQRAKDALAGDPALGYAKR
jgi:hypothetical protein